MRTTVRLDERLLAEVKQHAQASNKTLTLVIEDALREMLARRRVCQKRARLSVCTLRGTYSDTSHFISSRDSVLPRLNSSLALSMMAMNSELVLNANDS